MKRLPTPTRWKPKTAKEKQIYREWKAFCLRGVLRTRRLYVWRQLRAETWELWADEQYNRFGDQLRTLQRTTNSMVATLKYPELFEVPDHDKRLVRQLASIELQARLMRSLLLKHINHNTLSNSPQNG